MKRLLDNFLNGYGWNDERVIVAGVLIVAISYYVGSQGQEALSGFMYVGGFGCLYLLKRASDRELEDRSAAHPNPSPLDDRGESRVSQIELGGAEQSGPPASALAPEPPRPPAAVPPGWTSNPTDLPAQADAMVASGIPTDQLQIVRRPWRPHEWPPEGMILYLTGQEAEAAAAAGLPTEWLMPGGDRYYLRDVTDEPAPPAAAQPPLEEKGWLCSKHRQATIRTSAHRGINYHACPVEGCPEMERL